MSLQESERRTVAMPSGSPTSVALKDSPSVERALGRSKIYLLISWGMLYPEDDEFLDYLQCGEFVEDGRSALDSLSKDLEGIGGDRARSKLAAVRKSLDQIEAWVASECAHWKI